MKLFKKKFLLLAVFFLGVMGQSQAQKMVPGYVITAGGDSLSGSLSQRDLKNYRDSALFRSGEKSFYINTANTRSFGTYDPGEVFEKWTGTLDMSHLNDKYELYADTVRNATIFIRRIYTGSTISLFHYFDLKDHFFVRFNGSVEELIHKYAKPAVWQGMKSGKSPHHNEIQIFRNQLYRYFDWQNDERLRTKIDFAEYNSKTLLSIVKSIDASYQSPKKKKG